MISPLPFSLRLQTRHTYYTAKDAETGVEIELEDEADITINSGEDTEDLVDLEEFNPASDHEDLQNMNVD
jgi:hypothetical protein